MLTLLIEIISMGCITFIIGTILFNLTINKENNDNNNNKIKYPMGINLSFFMIGIVLQLLLSYNGINNWYCRKSIVSSKDPI
jgi:hypothetical protein